ESLRRELGISTMPGRYRCLGGSVARASPLWAASHQGRLATDLAHWRVDAQWVCYPKKSQRSRSRGLHSLIGNPSCGGALAFRAITLGPEPEGARGCSTKVDALWILERHPRWPERLGSRGWAVRPIPE